VAEDTYNAEAISRRAADWLSTVLSIPIIWPKSTAVAAIGTLFVSLFSVVCFTRPHAASVPRPDAQRVAEIQDQVRQAESRYRSQLPAGASSGTASGTDLSDAIFNPDHWRKHNESPRVHAN